MAGPAVRYIAVPPAVPILPMIARIRSFAVQPAGRRPFTVIPCFSRAFGLVCVATLCSTSEVPTQSQCAESTMCGGVEVSQTRVTPGCVNLARVL